MIFTLTVRFAITFGVIILICIVSLSMICQTRKDNNAKVVPPDFRIEALAGGVHPWQENYYVLIASDGRGKFARYVPERVGEPPLEENEFSLGKENLIELKNTIEQADFFRLDAENKNESVTGGWFASLTVSLGGKTHRVEIENVDVPSFNVIIQTLNNLTPPGNDLIFGKIQSAPRK